MDLGLPHDTHPHDTLATRIIVIQLQLRGNRVSTLSRRVVTTVVPAHRTQLDTRARASENVLALP